MNGGSKFALCSCGCLFLGEGSTCGACAMNGGTSSKLAIPPGGFTYATPEIKASAEYQAAEAFEFVLSVGFPGLFAGSRVDVERFERAAVFWDACGFFGWADNYRAAIRRLASSDFARAV